MSEIDYGADAASQNTNPKDPGLTLLIEDLDEARREEAKAEAAFKKAKQYREMLETKTIPEKLIDMGLGGKVTLADGRTLTFSEQTYVSIPAATKAEAFQWLKDHGFGKMVKEETKETVSTSGLRPMADDLPTNLFKLNTVQKVNVK